MRRLLVTVSVTVSVTVLLITGCDEVGLDSLGSGLMGPILEVAPEGEIAFGGTAFDGGSSSKVLELLSTGDEDLFVLDVYFDDETSYAFKMNDDLPLPLKLPPGKVFPVDLFFEPDSIGSHNGWVVVTVKAEDGTRDLSRRVLGQGCDPEYAEGDCS